MVTKIFHHLCICFNDGFFIIICCL